MLAFPFWLKFCKWFACSKTLYSVIEINFNSPLPVILHRKKKEEKILPTHSKPSGITQLNVFVVTIVVEGRLNELIRLYVVCANEFSRSVFCTNNLFNLIRFTVILNSIWPKIIHDWTIAVTVKSLSLLFISI